MFPWGAIIGLAGQAVSAGLSAKNNQLAQQEADAEAARERAFYEAKANEDPLSRSENQHILGQYDRAAQRQVETARNIAAITGATPELGLAVQKGVAEGRANLMGQMAAGASARKDRYETMGEMARHRKANEDMQRRLARNNTYAALAGNAASAVGAIMDGYSAKMPKANSPQLNNDPSAPETKAAEQTGYSDQKKMQQKISTGEPDIHQALATSQINDYKQRQLDRKRENDSFYQSLSHFNIG